mmetsp:Transcript_23339/g.57430  ORF Transcript_23339/g.57430 Transcript_23339/m.57430 type:complete len:486 (-) Transcript_23339:224-1681(-)
MKSNVSRKGEQHRVLTPTEKEEFLAIATRLHGLPQDWDVEWDNKRHKKIWVSPDGSRRCYSLPQALKYAVKLGQVVLSTTQSSSNGNGNDGNGNDGGQETSVSQQHTPLHHRKLTPQEVAEKVQEGRSRGLPEGWTMVWDNMSDQRVWISPDGKKKCKGIPQALRHSLRQGWIAALPQKEKESTNRVLTSEEVQEFLEEAREMGLPNGWNVEWNNAKRKRRWIAPDGCKVHSIPEALRMSLKKNWISKLPNPNNDPKPTSSSSKNKHSEEAVLGESEDPVNDTHSKNDQQEKNQTLSSKESIPRRRRRPQHIPSGNRQLTESEQLASMEEAKARGLEGGWKAEFSNHLNRRVWICPSDNSKKYYTIADALAGIPMSEHFEMPKDKKKKRRREPQQRKGTGTTKKKKSSTRKRKLDKNQAERTLASLDDSSEEESTSLHQLRKRLRRKKKRRHEETDKASSDGESTEDDGIYLEWDASKASRIVSI